MSSKRPFRFAVQTHRAESAEDWREQARKAEAFGYDTFVMPDHIGQGLLAPMVALMQAAEVTSTLRVGTLTLANDFREPALMASEIATIDLLSGGRFELGIGAGWDEADYRVAGIPFDPGKVRVDRFEESITILKRLFTEDSVTAKSEHYNIENLVNFPKPVQQPHPPILIGAGMPRMLSFAAREADIISVMPPGLGGPGRPDMSADAMEVSLDRIREKAGDRFDQIELNMLLQHLNITDDRQQAAAELGERWEMTTDEALDCPCALIGTIDQIIETIEERRERFGLSYWTFRGHQMEALAPAVARLSGK